MMQILTMNINILPFVLAYTLLPNLYYRSFSSKIIKKVPKDNNTVALTFDDGPDPRYTPLLLEVLKKNNIKCTFFVLAEKAEKYPELIKRISEEGHYIGLHYLNHVSAIIRSPRQTKKDLSKSIAIMKDLGIDVKFFRPPWGTFNPLTYYYAKANHFKIILWSLHALDWSRWVSVDYIKNRLITKVKSGDIILLHDGRGAKDAPMKTISALETTLPALKEKGYSFILVKDF